ncbi:hypothetical protein FQN60_006141 [Etheostoma spectabile]|uniref:Uncharacterized protein n=1 Tax=Etheostoma spectabile TaxID=54343 RepID=A0A5J5CQ03_9PERO|nr:hypothetical protein FQN60_006141 [Etheostoma spectabile]
MHKNGLHTCPHHCATEASLSLTVLLPQHSSPPTSLHRKGHAGHMTCYLKRTRALLPTDNSPRAAAALVTRASHYFGDINDNSLKCIPQHNSSSGKTYGRTAVDNYQPGCTFLQLSVYHFNALEQFSGFR